MFRVVCTCGESGWINSAELKAGLQDGAVVDPGPGRAFIGVCGRCQRRHIREQRDRRRRPSVEEQLAEIRQMASRLHDEDSSLTVEQARHRALERHMDWRREPDPGFRAYLAEMVGDDEEPVPALAIPRD